MFSIFHELLEQEVDRKEFITYLGIALLTVLGISGLIHALSQPLHRGLLNRGFGSGTYGGSKR
jgi:hypothetical protein